jgi:hypothetical protein
VIVNTQTFFELDFQWSLFPLKTNLIVIKHHHDALAQYMTKILSDDPAHAGDNFLPQARVHAAKPRHHLRRTVVLDPVASYFLYDLVLRNRTAFGVETNDTRKTFGYRFKDDKPVPIHTAYKEFIDEASMNAALLHGHSLSFDIASYFNSIYHHDAVNWFAALPGVTGIDVNAFGRFFREINAGRSIDFLPQGIYPSKMIGSEFLRFVEQSGQLKCAQTLRFMDDMHLYDDDPAKLLLDFVRIQELLGLRGLNINPTKTIVDSDQASVHEAASAIQQEIAAILDGLERAPIALGSGVEFNPFEAGFATGATTDVLHDKQLARLLELLVDSKADETNVELILGILHEHSDRVSVHIPTLLARFPNIVKQLYKLVGQVASKDALADDLLSLVKSHAPLLEYQLFWVAAIAEDHLATAKSFGKLVLALYERTSTHKIARAKVLEIPDQSFGLKEIRDETLKSGSSDWPAWAAAVGTRTLPKAERNHALKYFSKGSPLNYLIAQCVQSL